MLRPLAIALGLLVVGGTFDGNRYGVSRMLEQRMVANRLGTPERGGASFELEPGGTGTGGYDYLSAGLTINGTTVAPTLRCLGEDADGTDWDCTGTDAAALALQAGGAPTTGAAVPTVDTNDRAVDFNAGGWYQAPNNSIGNLGTDDIVIEAVFQAQVASASREIIAKRDTNGIEFFVDTSWKVSCRVDVGASTITAVSDAVSPGSWNHAMCFVNRDEASSSGMQLYVNGAVSGVGKDASAAAGSLNDAVPLGIGAYTPGGAAPYNDGVAFVQITKSPAWFAAGSAGRDQWTVVAGEELSRLTGLYPQIARGTATPTAMTRATSAKILKGNTYHDVGDHWLRVESPGYLVEPVRTNKVLDSDTLQATWTPVACAVGQDGDTYPGGATMDSINGTAVDTAHALIQAVTLTAATWTMSAWATASNLDFARLQDSSVVHQADFQISTCSFTGTSTAVIDTFAEVIGGECRVGMSFTGTAAAHVLGLVACEADNDCSYTGDTTADVFFGGVQVELGGSPSSPITTTAASGAVDRNGDVLTYKMDGGNLGGVGSNKTGTMEYVITAGVQGATCYYGSLSDGGAGADKIIAYSSSGASRNAGTAGGATVWTFTGGANVWGGYPSAFTNRVVWGVTALGGTQAWTNGASGGTDTTVADVPDDLDQLDIGMQPNNTTQCIAHYDRFTLWPEKRAP